MESITTGVGEDPQASVGAASSAVVQSSPTDSTRSETSVEQSTIHTPEAERDSQNEEIYASCASEGDKPVSDDPSDKAVSAPERKKRKKEDKQRRAKGTGGLQQEKTGIWTVRALVNGQRISKSTGTKDKAEAERFLRKFLAPYVKDDAERTFENIKIAVASEKLRAEMDEEKLPQMKLGEVWGEYLRSPMRRDLAKATLHGKEQVWRSFMEYLQEHHKEVIELRHLQPRHCEAYLDTIRDGHSALTYNNRLCVLREMTRVLMKKALLKENPWDDFKLRPDDSHTRREFTIEELARIIDLAGREGPEWRTLFGIGMYTGLRLGDCCRLTWGEVDIVRSVIQKIPEKTKKYRKGRPVTIPIHKTLADLLMQTPVERRVGYILPQIGQWVNEGPGGMRKIQHRLGKIFHNAGIVTSVKVEGRKWKAPEAGFHSLRHTFVSLSANAGVPLHIVQSIVGHESTTMTRHYYHENLGALQQAVEAIPSISETGEVREGEVAQPDITRMYNRMAAPAPKPPLPAPPPPPPMPEPEVIEVPMATVVSEDGVTRANPAADAPLAGRSAEKNAARREEKLAAVEKASQDAVMMGGWGLEEAKVSALPTVNRRQRQEWISKCVRRWCAMVKVALLDGTTKLIGNGGYRFLQEIWDKGVPMLPDDAVQALDVYLRANGVRGEFKGYA